MPSGADRPLAGIVVLDFGQVYQGPYATLLMAKAGADVIKIEPPQGEPLRRRAPPGKSTTFPIAMLNSNKRAITLNLKHERGRALLFRMVERGDVLLENFAPGVMDRLGVGWEVLHQINPRLVHDQFAELDRHNSIVWVEQPVNEIYPLDFVLCFPFLRKAQHRRATVTYPLAGALPGTYDNRDLSRKAHHPRPNPPHQPADHIEVTRYYGITNGRIGVPDIRSALATRQRIRS